MNGPLEEVSSIGDQEKTDQSSEENVSNERPYVCDICDSRFNRRSTLWNHKRIHSESRPFVCPVCNHQFKWKNSLKCHRAMHVRKGESEQEIPEGAPRRKRPRKNKDGSEKTVGTATKSVPNDGDGGGRSEESRVETGSIDHRYCPEEQPHVTQLPSLVSTVFEPVREERQESKAGEWYECAGVGGKGKEETGYYAKVLPHHMW